MQRKKNNGLLIGILIIMVSSCGQLSNTNITSNVTPVVSSPTPLSSTTPSPVMSVQVTKTATLEATATSLPVTLTPIPTIILSPTSTQMIDMGNIPVCSSQGIPIQPPVGFGLPGAIVYEGQGIHGLYSVGGSPLTHSQLPVDQTRLYEAFGFSPNGEWLAFSPIVYDAEGNQIYENPTIVLLSASGERVEYILDTSSIQSEIPEGDLFGGFGFGSWINNDLLYAYFNVLVQPDLVISRYEGRSSVVDVFNGVLISEAIANLENMDGKQYMGFSPDMSRVLYQSVDGFVLFDLINNRPIWSNQIQIPYGVIVDWSPDSSYVAYAILGRSNDLDSIKVSILSREGGLETIILNSSFGYQVGFIKWSPDGRRLAIVVQNDVGDSSVFIYDIENSQYVLYCPIVGYEIVRNLFWSPEGEYLAYADIYSPLQVLNIQTGDVIELVGEGMAVGWSDKFPTVWP